MTLFFEDTKGKEIFTHPLVNTSPWGLTLFIDCWNLKIFWYLVLFSCDLFLYCLIVSAQNLPVGPLSCDKTAGTWQVARVNSRLSHSIANCDTNDKGNSSFKWTHFYNLRKLFSCLWAVVFTSAGSSKIKEDAEFACALTSSTPVTKKKMLKKGQ